MPLSTGQAHQKVGAGGFEPPTTRTQTKGHDLLTVAATVTDFGVSMRSPVNRTMRSAVGHSGSKFWLLSTSGDGSSSPPLAIITDSYQADDDLWVGQSNILKSPGVHLLTEVYLENLGLFPSDPPDRGSRHSPALHPIWPTLSLF